MSLAPKNKKIAKGGQVRTAPPSIIPYVNGERWECPVCGVSALLNKKGKFHYECSNCKTELWMAVVR